MLERRFETEHAVPKALSDGRVSACLMHVDGPCTASLPLRAVMVVIGHTQWLWHEVADATADGNARHNAFGHQRYRFISRGVPRSGRAMVVKRCPDDPSGVSAPMPRTSIRKFLLENTGPDCYNQRQGAQCVMPRCGCRWGFVAGIIPRLGSVERRSRLLGHLSRQVFQNAENSCNGAEEEWWYPTRVG